MSLGTPTGLESVTVVPEGATERDLAPGSQSHPSVRALVTESPEPKTKMSGH